MTTVISLLGKSLLDQKNTGYRTANYRFEDGSVRVNAFFGLALADHIKADRLILAGTAGSMWDYFFTSQDATEDESLIEFIDAVKDQRVTQEMLKAEEYRLSQKLERSVTMLLIPYARDEAEQATILQSLASVVTEQEKVVIDVTHGYRHLPMLALVAARYLSHVRQVQVEELYYGAFEMRSTNANGVEVVPVLKLGSMLRMLDWVEALAVYDRSGDYGVFSPLLVQDGMAPEKADLLQQAAFFERTSNPVKAREKLSTVFDAVKSHQGALGALFSEALSKRVNWFRKSTRADWELTLSNAYLGHKDYLRSATYLYESCITRATLDQGADINDFDVRKEAYGQIRSQDHETLRYLRNGMAHGLREQENKSKACKNANTALVDQSKLVKLLRELYKKLG